ncbi:MAG: hypothetical protein ABJN65_11745 [Parasphingorhabdus sp.]
MRMLKDVSASGGISDLIAVIRQGEKGERWLPALLSIGCTGFILFLFILDPKVNTYTYVPQEVIFVENWTEERSDEDILKDRWEVQCLKEKQADKRRDAMKRLGELSGMDVEEIEREAEQKRIARGEVLVELPPGTTC